MALPVYTIFGVVTLVVMVLLGIALTWAGYQEDIDFSADADSEDAA